MTAPVAAGAEPATPWSVGTATGVGSLPGTAMVPALRLVLDDLVLPHLPELPARGPGADLVGRGAGLLLDLAVDLQPAGWRFVPRPGHDAQRTADLLARDLDDLTEAADGWVGPLKVQVCGPWTLTAALELQRGDKVIADRGASRDVASSLADGLARHVTEVRARVPGCTQLLVQLDEPSLPAVLAGRLRTASGFGTLRVPERPEVEATLRSVLAAVIAAGGTPGVHCCSAGPPLELLRELAPRWVSIDLTVHRQADDDALGELLESPVAVAAGLVPAVGTIPAVADAVRPLRAVWRRLGLRPDALAEVAVTPTCGLAGRRDLAEAGEVLRRATECALELAE